MVVQIEIDVTAACGLVLQQAGRPAVRGVRIRNEGEKTLVGMTLTVSSDVGLFHPLVMALDAVQPGETVSVSIPDGEPALDYKFLSELTDMREGEVRAVLTDAVGEEIAFASARQTIYAPDQTLGCERPIYYASFVVPNCDAVARLQPAVAKALEEMTGSGSITGYLHEKSSVYALCKAAYRAVQALGITYAVSPATFGQPGQKVRLPDEIVRYKTGCCLDTTLFFAALFEKCGLRPVIVLFREHALVGCHLVDRSFAEPVTADVLVLRKAIQEDTFVVLETTQVGGDGSFAEAESSAKIRLAEGASFECAVDVALARGMGVHALPVAPGGGFGEVDGREVNARDAAARTLADDVDLDALDAGGHKGLAEARVEGWAQRLLDLSKANRLLNVRDTAKVIPLLCSSSVALENALAADVAFSVKSYESFLDEEAGRAFVKLEKTAALEQYRVALDNSQALHELWSLLGRRETERRLKELFRAARVDLDESGVNTLFLALGVLTWCERGREGAQFRAPVLLVPVKIERRSVADGYRIRRIDEEPIVNTTLLELLKREYKLGIPGLDPLPTDESGLDVAKIFGIFRAAVRDLRGLSVSEDCMLGQFSFGKFVMWKDLTSRLDAVRSNLIVSHLIARRGTHDDGVDVFPAGDVDSHFDYAKVCCPLSADSSQLAAVLYSGLGKSFVLHGPPGTGKSQTITNIIAHNLSLGRRVLFVSEKKAALDVVYGRLARLGLAPFCLQLHSNKSGKAEVYAQFHEALALGLRTPSPDWTALVRETEALRRKLDGYVRALHRQTVSGFTPYDLFTKLLRSEIDGDGTLATCCARETPASEYEAACRAIVAAAEMREGIPTDAVRALGCVRPFAWSPAAEMRLADAAARLAKEIRAAADAVAALGGSFEEDARYLERYFAQTSERQALEKSLGSSYVAAELRKVATKEIRRRLVAAEQSFFPIRILKERAICKELSLVVPSGRLGRESIREVLRLAHALQEADAAIARGEAHAQALLDGGFDRAMADSAVRAEARARAELAYEKLMAELSGLIETGSGTVGPDVAVGRAEAVAAHARGNLRRAFMYFDARKRIPASAAAVAALIDETERPVPAALVSAFEKAFQSKLLNEVMESEPAFGSFFGAGREMDIARFRELDERYAQATVANLIARLSREVAEKSHDPASADARDARPYQARAPECFDDSVGSRVPRDRNGRGRRGDTSELGLLLHECGKKARQKPVRQILAETPTLTPAIKPCFLMSPLSVAQYLPVDAGQFDLVVFDEASQIPVWDAIGVIARGRQLIVVGDPKQLPPTSFFQKGPGEEEACEDLESILDECLHAGLMSCFLGWHYRSRHESLIAFSNHRYYGSRLHLFPAASLSDRMGVSFVHVPDGVYDARGTRTNRREAEVVADLVVARLQAPECAGKSIGVVTFSEAQRNLIEDILDERRAEHPELEQALADREGEEFFVKNLENVQGDERDAIVFSVGYAPDATGKFNMVFGPLSNQGGERRLNVAITRAREKIIVVSSIHGHQIDVERTSTQGPGDLRAFLEYAEKGYRIALPYERTCRDGFAAEVAAVLEKAGARVSLDVGCGGTRVDVAVRDQEDGARYVFGVVCDGCGYAAELTARDRDRLRDDVLASLGWNVHHVWIVDWAYDRERAEKRLLEAFDKSINRKENDK